MRTTAHLLRGNSEKATVNLGRLKMKDKMRGKAEEVKGKITGDKVLQIKGQARQKVGGVKEAAKSIAYDANRSNKPVR
jgi:uncharacterized protein YjbJ (UPF0337 family)